MNPFEVTAYITLTEFLLNHDYMEDGFLLYILCGALAGVNGLMVGNPFDVIRTVQVTSNKKLSLIQTARKIITKKGIQGIYMGFTANVYRVAGWNSINFCCYSLIEKYVAEYKRNQARTQY